MSSATRLFIGALLAAGALLLGVETGGATATSHPDDRDVQATGGAGAIGGVGGAAGTAGTGGTPGVGGTGGVAGAGGSGIVGRGGAS
jgi:hypothetical protein